MNINYHSANNDLAEKLTVILNERGLWLHVTPITGHSCLKQFGHSDGAMVAQIREGQPTRLVLHTDPAMFEVVAHGRRNKRTVEEEAAIIQQLIDFLTVDSADEPQYEIVHEGSENYTTTHADALIEAHELSEFFASVEPDGDHDVTEQWDGIYIGNQHFAQPIDTPNIMRGQNI